MQYHNMTDSELMNQAWMDGNPLAGELLNRLTEIIEDDEKGQLEEHNESLQKEVSELENQVSELESKNEELLEALLEASKSDNPDWDYINSVINNN